MTRHKFSITMYLLLGVFLVWLALIYFFSDRVPEKGNYKTVHTDNTSFADTKLHLQFLTMESSADPLQTQLDPVVMKEIDEIVRFSRRADLYNAIGSLEKLGVALARYEDGFFTLKVTFAGAQQLTGTDYFEGWLIQNKPFRSVSLGRFFSNGAGWKLLYRTKSDFMSYPILVVTREHDDGNRAPGDLILEGKFY